MRKSILKIYLYTIGIGFAYWVWGQLTGLYLPCLYYRSTGYLCPGCGVSRMCLALIRLDFSAAFHYNPVILILLGIWNIIAILICTNRVKFVQKERFLYGMLIVTVVALVTFAFLRNIS